MAFDSSAAERNFPHVAGFDSTASLLVDGYDFIGQRCRRYGSDAFRTRLLMRPVTCVRGADAAAMFYHPGRFTRRGAMPPTALALLQDHDSVQQLDGAAHEHRKRLFLTLLDAASTARLVAGFRDAWRSEVETWVGAAQVTLQIEAERILFRAACQWAGIPLDGQAAVSRAGDIADMIDGAGAIGPRWVRGWLERERTERWLRGVIRRLRAEDAPASASPAAAIAAFRDPRGRRLPSSIAAIELLNLLRPIVAVARWITFAALALERHPDIQRRLQAGEPGLLYNTVQEVRRFYPFFPMIGGRVREPFAWHGRHFERGEWVILDLYGTDHDPSAWSSPDRFDPDRFGRHGDRSGALVAQGAGDYLAGHRCPGENPSIALLMVAVGELVGGIRYQVPPQDLGWRLDRIPSRPASGFVMCEVRTAPARTPLEPPAVASRGHPRRPDATLH